MGRTKYLNDDEIEKITQNLPSLYRGIWELCLETGVRVSDALEARFCDFDANGNFYFVAQKTGKNGVAKVSKDFLKTYIGRKSSKAYVFPSPKFPKAKNKHVTRQAFFMQIKKACLCVGINPDGVAPHSTRKHFAVELYHSKGLSATMQALQHADVGTTLLYALSDDALNDIMNRLKLLENRVDRLVRRFAVVESSSEACYDYLFGDMALDIKINSKSH